MSTVTAERLTIEEFCSQHEDIIDQRVRKWVKKSPNGAFQHQDQLISEGYLALVTVANNQPDLTRSETRSYVARAIDNNIRDYIRRNCEALKLPLRSTNDEDYEPISTCAVREEHVVNPDHFEGMESTDEILNGCCKSEFERDVMRLRLAGYTDKEVS